MTQMNQTGSLFSELGIGAKILEALGQKFTTPTPIQAQVIPQALTGRDIIGIAQTGTGKTLAFGIPMLEQLSKKGGQAVVLLPTRELALQVEEVLKPLARALRLETAVLIGGAAIRPQIQQLRRRPAIIVATPGRLADHLHQRNVTLNEVKIVVLDEADRMLDIGFLPQIKEILAAAPKARQTLLFSATMPTAIAAIAKNYMIDPVRVEVAPAGTSSANVEQAVIMTKREDKIRLLEKLLNDHDGTVLVFSRTKHGARKIARATNNLGHTAAEIHSDRSLAQRKDALAGFKNGKYRVLVATDIASRGIDVKEISLVINYDLPDNIDDYVHRIGRTGRAGAFGRALSFAGHDERYAIAQIERLIRKKLTILDVPAAALPPQQVAIQQSMSRVYPDADLRSTHSNFAPRHSSRPSYSGRPSRAPLQRHARSARPTDKKFIDMPLKKTSGKPGRKFNARPNRVKPKFSGSSKSRFKR